MSDDRPAESYTGEELDAVRASMKEALEVIDRLIASRRRVVYGDSGPGWSPDQ